MTQFLQRFFIDSNDGMQNQIPLGIDPGKDENYTFDKKVLILSDSSIESQDNTKSEVLNYDYVLKEESDVLTFKLTSILDDTN